MRFADMKRIKAFLECSDPVKWLFYGDSITHGAVHTFGRRDYTEYFAERVRAEMGRRMDMILNTAISGNTTQDLLESFDWRVAHFRPDVVFLMIGMNDCSPRRKITIKKFRSNLHKLADKIEDCGGLLVLQTTCPILKNTEPEREKRFPIFMQAIRDVARERSLPLVDHEAVWKKLEGKQHWLWMSNAFHPNAAGHIAFAHELFRQLGIYDPRSITCRLFTP